MKKIWKWFITLSNISKLAIFLGILLTIFNVGGTIYTSKKILEANASIDRYVFEQKAEIGCVNNDSFSSSINDLVEGLIDSAKLFVEFLITLISTIIIYYLCKTLDFFQDKAKNLAFLDKDGMAINFIILYDVLNIFYSIQTINGFTNILK